ncbi:MAG TPA: hypothetical protein VFF68_06545, partial [Anaerolineaceae bacterium]|nr:hypothetical protein [Anaerolineaceae bacterium]
MAIRDLVIHSQLIPPNPRKGVLYRARLIERLCAVYDFPLTIVQAGTGHSKTTTLAGFAGQADNLFWYTITEPDRDPLLFLAHLISAFNQSGFALGEPALQALEENGGRVTPTALTPLMNRLTTGLPDPSVLVLDDFHLVSNVPLILSLVERLVDYAPRQLHVVLATRQMPQFPSGALTRWQAKNQLLLLKRGDLAFTPVEIEALFLEHYGLPITTEQVQALAVETEGWAIALQVIWQSLKSGAVDSVDEVLHRLPETLESLFSYLAQDVLARLPHHEQNFLLTSSVLRQLTGAACDALLGLQGSEHTLNRLVDRGLFLLPVGEGDAARPGKSYRYQHLFHDFLLAQLARDPARARRLHRQAAAYFEANQQLEETIHHLLAAEDFDQAAGQIERIGNNLIQSGRLDSLVG